MDLYIDSLVFDFCPLLISILIWFVFIFEFNYIFVPRLVLQSLRLWRMEDVISVSRSERDWFLLRFFVIFIFIEIYLCWSISIFWFFGICIFIHCWGFSLNDSESVSGGCDFCVALRETEECLRRGCHLPIFLHIFICFFAFVVFLSICWDVFVFTLR